MTKFPHDSDSDDDDANDDAADDDTRAIIIPRRFLRKQPS